MFISFKTSHRVMLIDEFRHYKFTQSKMCMLKTSKKITIENLMLWNYRSHFPELWLTSKMLIGHETQHKHCEICEINIHQILYVCNH